VVDILDFIVYRFIITLATKEGAMKAYLCVKTPLAITFATICSLLAWPALTPAQTLIVTTSIQSVIDQAAPGDTVIVHSGTYHESLTINKDGITLRGDHDAILDASGFDVGVRVGVGEITTENGHEVCPPVAVHNFSLLGFTIQNAKHAGVRLIGVDGFRLRGGHYFNNGEYGPYPVCSMRGRMLFNHVEGAGDAALYVGQDAQITVIGNSATRSRTGIEVANSEDCIVKYNVLSNNTAGILVVADPGSSRPFTNRVTIERNWVSRNNFLTDPPPGGEASAALLPAGTGILNAGGDRVVIEKNVVTHNNTVGVAISPDPFALLDPRVDPFPDDNQVRANIILSNGKDPNGTSQNPRADVIYLTVLSDPTSGQVLQSDLNPDNCFSENVFGTEYPRGITERFPCN
jgi:parallel beta-helix repeat protein